jgi:soluble cytochrome b562
MALDETDFVDRDYQVARAGTPATTPGPAASPTSTASTRRAPTREELDSQLTATQQQLTKLREAQEQLERARAAVEELRRKRAEYQNGRDEMLQHLTRAIGILEKSELDARREAEQASRSLEGLRLAIHQVNALNEQAWTEETWDSELNKALVTLENARMEWNSARLRWPILEEQPQSVTHLASSEPRDLPSFLAKASFGQLCRIGFALTWPLGAVALLALIGSLLALAKR